MLERLFSGKFGRDRAYLMTRVLLVLGFSLVLVLLRSPDWSSSTEVEAIAIPALVGLGSVVVLGVLSAIPATREYVSMLSMPADWLLLGAYIYFGLHSSPMLLLGFSTLLVVTGMLNLGSSLGAVHAAGSLLVVFVVLAVQPRVGLDDIQREMGFYGGLALLLIIAAALTAIWHNTIDVDSTSQRKERQKALTQAEDRLGQIRERIRAFSDMAERLNETLNYDRILDAAMDVGRLSIRHDPRHRVISLAIMVQDEETMVIANARGLQEPDMHTGFKGQRGVIRQAMYEGKPVIHKGGEEDPELGRLNAFVNIRTTVVIPLRAHLETYGVLVFASTAPNAIHEDHIDTLAAIGVQATLALKNSVLYNSLRDEKERIIRIEKNARQALVRDLHDIPTQTVSAVAMQLSTIPMIAQRTPDKLKEEVENIREMALRATEEIRHVMFTLRPLVLESAGLVGALEQLGERMEKTYDQAITLNIDPRVENVLDQEAQDTLFYLIGEAANNARKYAKASMIRVHLSVEEDAVSVVVQDNGIGFDIQSTNSNYEGGSSFGMVNMRERASLINGLFDMKSAPGKGTKVTVRVPIQDEHRGDPNRRSLIRKQRVLSSA